jgi:hypothetical protein
MNANGAQFGCSRLLGSVGKDVASPGDLEIDDTNRLHFRSVCAPSDCSPERILILPA